MTVGKRNLVISILSAGLIFMMGLLYLTIPNYYGLEAMSVISTNDLLLSALLVYSVVKFGEYVLVGKNPTNENVFLTITASSVGIINVLLNVFVEPSMALSISLMVFTLGIILVKLFTMDYYHDRENGFWYVELIYLIIFTAVGIITSCNLFNDSILQTIMLGYYFIIVGVLESLKATTKSLLKSKKFLKSIK